MSRLILRVLISLVVALTAGLGALGANAQEPGALVISKFVCPDDLSADAIDPAACTDPAAGVEFFVANPNTDNVEFGTTGGDGLVSFPLDQFAISPDGALVDVGEILGSNPYGEVSGYLVSCTLNGEPLDVDYEVNDVQPGGRTVGIQFTVNEGDQVACEWYDSHTSAGGDNGGDTGEDGGPVTELPSTGTGPVSDGAGIEVLIGAALVTLAGAVALRLSLHRRLAA